MALPQISPYAMPTGADIPRPKPSWQLDPSRAALLVHDMQNYFLAPYDTARSPVTDLVSNLVRLRAACAAAGVPVIYSAQPGSQDPVERALLTDFWGPGLDDDPALTSIVDALAPGSDDTVLTKWRYSAFQRTDLAERLAQAGRDQLVVTGVYGHIGVLSTCVEAFMRDVAPFLVGDAIADFSLADHRMTLDWVSRRCGAVVTTDTVAALFGGGAAAAASGPFSEDTLRGLVATMLDENPAAIATDENLADLGLDSVRLMSLVESWRSAGVEVSLADLAAEPTIAGWHRLLTGR